ncbi:MAG: acylglycerol kinase family protein, partial [Chloroflexi bacterium]|nr:acylglycerol kinase family protein [Chloroflexota bacterium]
MQANDIVFVINPNSGHALHPRTLTALCRAACDEGGHTAEVIATRSPEEATEAARQAHESGAAAIFGCGGDGTLSSILQGLPVGSSTALGAVPLGTANVWAYETNLPMTPMAAISSQLAALEGRQGSPIWIDTGRVWSTLADGSVASQRFLLMASWGLDAAAVNGIAGSSRRTGMKRTLGEPAYFLSAVQEA